MCMTPKRIVIHCSASGFGDWKVIDAWHKARGWGRTLAEAYKSVWILRYGFWPVKIHIGYHAVILNGCRQKNKYLPALDGKIEPGRPENMPGAHCPAVNSDSLGVCMIGNPGFDEYTDKQYAALVHWCAVKCKQYGIPVSMISQHSDWDKGKPLCASLHLEQLRGDVAEKMAEVA